MKIVTRPTYYFWTAIYHSLCISGLIWQITQISMNYFLFDVNKDINVLMSYQYDQLMNRSYYICFYNDQIMDYDMYVDIMKRKGYERKKIYRNDIEYQLTFGERFDMTYEPEFISRKYKLIEFIRDTHYCYTNNDSMLGFIRVSDHHINYEMDNSYVLNSVDEIFVFVGNLYPKLDIQTFHSLKNVRNISTVSISSYFYNISRLQWPYVDDCFDYLSASIVDRNEYEVKCTENMTKKSYKNRMISKRDKHKYSNETYDYDNSERCPSIPTECKSLTIFNNLLIEKNRIKTQANVDFDSIEIFFKPKASNDPSFEITSKPRIDNIEYITYIFGAVGSWLGFSFLGLNPVPLLIKVKVVKKKDRNVKLKEFQREKAKIRFLFQELQQLKHSQTNLIQIANN